MVKAYLRYEHAQSFGVITSRSNICFDQSGKHIFAAALEGLAKWNIKQGDVVQTLVPQLSADAGGSGKPPAEVTQIILSQDGRQIAAGYADGMIRLWDSGSGEYSVAFSGHKHLRRHARAVVEAEVGFIGNGRLLLQSAVTALRYNGSGATLASGSKDTDIIVWDTAAEAGLFRLRGHRDQVNDLAFVDRHQLLVSCSKDSCIRVWDLDTQHCCQTVVGFRGEVWSLDCNPAQDRVVAGSADADIRMYSVGERGGTEAAAGGGGGDGGGGGARSDVLKPMGSIRRTAARRVHSLRFDATGRFLGCQAAGKVLEVFRCRTAEEVKRHRRRRKKRRKDKEGDAVEAIAETNADTKAELELVASDELVAFGSVKTKSKVSAFAFGPDAGGEGDARSCRLALSLANNTLQVVALEAGDDAAGGAASRELHRIERHGHRSDVRSAALSSDDQLLLTTSNAGAKLWNAKHGVCLRDVEAGYGLATLFAPGNRHAVVGTKEGTLDILDIAASSRLQSLEAHGGAVWSLAALPDSSGIVSGSADHTVKVWEWTIVSPTDSGAGRLTLTHTRTLRMMDDVLSVAVSPDGKLLAVAVLDSTVRVFHMDSFKWFLSLYGHKLPVLSMDISSDSQLIATGSADKNLRIWGLDFGDCHKSLFAHQDSVTAVAFVRDTHYVFTAGKDRMLKYWDADKFELLLELPGHAAAVWCLAVSRLGDFVVTGAQDRSLRRWQRTQEPFFVEEERERRLESLFEQDLETAAASGDGGDAEGAAARAGKRTQSSIGGTDAISEALDMASKEAERRREHEEDARRKPGAVKPLQPNLMMLGLDPEAYVLRAVSSIKSVDLEQALLVLPLTDAMKLLDYLTSWMAAGQQVELSCRVAVLLLSLHHQQLLGTPSARPLLQKLRQHLRRGVAELKDVMGFNLAACTHLRRRLAGREPEDGLAAGAGGQLGKRGA